MRAPAPSSSWATATAPGCTIRPTTSTTRRSRWGRPTGRGWWKRRCRAEQPNALFADQRLLAADHRLLARHAGAARQDFGEPLRHAAPERELVGARVFQCGKRRRCHERQALHQEYGGKHVDLAHLVRIGSRKQDSPED